MTKHTDQDPLRGPIAHTAEDEQDVATMAGPDAYEAARQSLWDAAVATLTEAVRLQHPLHGPVDFADFLASALAAVAANVGSVYRLTAGRPGSWESGLVDQLVTGTVGPDATAEELAGYRTAPVVVRLNVAQILSDAHAYDLEDRAAILPTLDDAWSALDAEFAAVDDRDEADHDRQAAAEQALRERYAAAFQAYADTFRSAVTAAASRLDPLWAPIEVVVDADPDAIWWGDGHVVNPTEWDEDKLAWRLWATARQQTGLPELD